MSMKLLLIGPMPLPVGGTTVLFQQLVDELSTRNTCELILVDTTRRGGRWQKLFGSFKQLFKLLWYVPSVDIVSLHASTNRLILLGGCLRFYCRIFRKPLIARVFGGSLSQSLQKLNRVKRMCCNSVMSAEVVLIEIQEMLRQLSQQFPQSNLEWFANSRPYDPTKITVLPCLKGSADKLTFSFISHVRVEKGIYELARAVQELSDCQNYEVRVYGPVFPEVDLAKLELSDTIRYRGELKSEEVAKVITESDLILLPSWYEGEGYPGTLLEAFVLGRPVIATDWKYIPEVVDEGVNGLLVTPKDHRSLANAMRRVLNDRDLLIQLSVGACESAAKFSSSYWNGDVFLEYCTQASGTTHCN